MGRYVEPPLDLITYLKRLEKRVEILERNAQLGSGGGGAFSAMSIDSETTPTVEEEPPAS